MSMRDNIWELVQARIDKLEAALKLEEEHHLEEANYCEEGGDDVGSAYHRSKVRKITAALKGTDT